MMKLFLLALLCVSFICLSVNGQSCTKNSQCRSLGGSTCAGSPGSMVCTCPSNTENVDGKCRCMAGYYRSGSGVDKACLQCSSTTTDGTSSGNTGVERCNCAAGLEAFQATGSNSGVCTQCSDPAFYNAGSSSSPDCRACDSATTVSGSTVDSACTCAATLSGFDRDTGVCEHCANGYFRDSDDGTCQSCVESDSNLATSSNDRCDCKATYDSFNTATGNCDGCADGAVRVDGVCTACDSSSTGETNGDDNCLCAANSQPTDGTSLTSCASCGTGVDSFSAGGRASCDTCENNGGSFFDGTNCITCDAASTTEGTEQTGTDGDGNPIFSPSCNCNEGYAGKDTSSNTHSCGCDGDFELNGECVFCGDGEEASGTSCVCKANHERNGEVCTECATDSYSNGGDDTCHPCPAPSFWRGGACVTCGQNAHSNLDKNRCECDAGAGSLDENEACTACNSENFEWSAGGHEAICNTCEAVNQVYGGVTSCITCSEGTTLNNGACECNSGHGDLSGEFEQTCRECAGEERKYSAGGADASCDHCNWQNQLVSNTQCIECGDHSTTDSGESNVGGNCQCDSGYTNGQVNSDVHSCDQCDAGYYNSAFGAGGFECSACDSTTTSGSDGQNACSCAAGYANFDAASGSCTSCDAGFYRFGSECLSCADAVVANNALFVPDTSIDQDGSASNEKCDCASADLTFFMTGPVGEAKCLGCPEQTVPSVPLNGCVSCGAGTRWTGSGCECDDLHENLDASGLVQTCSAKPMTACGYGTDTIVTPEGGCTCLEGATDFSVSLVETAVTGTCSSCESNNYLSDATTGDCSPCDGTTTRGSDGGKATSCECKLGYKNFNNGACVDCEYGYVRNADSGLCEYKGMPTTGCTTDCGKNAGCCINENLQAQCFRFYSNNQHCGSCSTSCSDNQQCCGLGCVDVLSSAQNCGACGVRCNKRQQCVNGACVAA
jgi:hypothetical protein